MVLIMLALGIEIPNASGMSAKKVNFVSLDKFEV